MSTPAPDERLVELESKLAFQEQTIEDLNEVVVEQGRLLEAISERLARLEQRLRGADDAGSETDPLQERPPHY